LKPRNLNSGGERVLFIENLEYFKDLRTLARQVGLSCRDVEKAIFKKDLDI
jgi:hypothetical protein